MWITSWLRVLNHLQCQFNFENIYMVSRSFQGFIGEKRDRINFGDRIHTTPGRNLLLRLLLSRARNSHRENIQLQAVDAGNEGARLESRKSIRSMYVRVGPERKHLHISVRANSYINLRTPLSGHFCDSTKSETSLSFHLHIRTRSVSLENGRSQTIFPPSDSVSYDNRSSMG